MYPPPRKFTRSPNYLNDLLNLFICFLYLNWQIMWVSVWLNVATRSWVPTSGYFKSVVWTAVYISIDCRRLELGLIYLHFESIFRTRPVVAVAVFVAVKWQQPVCHNRCLPSLIVSSSQVIARMLHFPAKAIKCATTGDPDDTLQVINIILKPLFAWY